MRLFLDANVLSYVAFFEGYLYEGVSELREGLYQWAAHQGSEPDGSLLREIYALRALYVIDDAAHFDFLFSDIALDEVAAIRSTLKRYQHESLLEKLIEHRADVYEEGRGEVGPAREERFATWRSLFPERMWKDARQLAEADVVEADYFLTNDLPFIRKTAALPPGTAVMRPSDLPFLQRELQVLVARGG